MKSEWGETARSLTRKRGHSEKQSMIVELLTRYGAQD